MREQKQVEDRAQGLLYLRQNSKEFAFQVVLTPPCRLKVLIC